MSFDCACQSNTPASSADDSPRLTQRAVLTEMMDEPCLYDDLRACLQDLANVNTLTRNYCATLRWIAQFVPAASSVRPLHIVDVGCGGGDMLRRIEQWAVESKCAVRLTGIDLNPHAIRAAREFTPPSSSIQWVIGRAEDFDVSVYPVDLAVCSLFTHHLSDREIVAFLRWIENIVRGGWFISDLYRTRTARWGFAALAVAARWHRFVRHDGPVSFRRAFLPDEWERLLEAAGLPAGAVGIDSQWPARICVSRVKEP